MGLGLGLGSVLLYCYSAGVFMWLAHLLPHQHPAPPPPPRLLLLPPSLSGYHIHAFLLPLTNHCSLIDAMPALVFSFTIAKCPNNPAALASPPPPFPGPNLRPAFSGVPLRLPPPPPAARAGPWNRSGSKTHRRFPRTPAVLMMVKPAIQFIQGTDEQTIPDVRLTKSKDGTNGVAIFSFDQPSVFDSSGELGDITGFYMIDEEGVLQSVDVSAKFVNGKPSRIEAKYVMKSPKEWDRFMRFMERYSRINGLQFVKK